MGGLTVVELSSGGNEASDLLPVTSRDVLDAHGWERGFWTVLDEGPVERSIALIGHRAGAADAEGWEIHPLRGLPGEHAGRTEDAEACARLGDRVYVIGSHYGSKDGPLQARRAFVARFAEAAIDGHVADQPAGLEIARNGFRLHRAINDALRAADLDVVVPGERVRSAFIDATVRRGEERAKRWAGRVQPGDVPLNIEAAAFRPGGTLLLGLRFPVTADGHPVLVELAGVEGMFADPRAWPEVVALWRLEGDGLSPPGRMTGLRALSARGGDAYDAIAGSLDATGKNSALLEDFPEGGDVHCSHWRFTLAGADARPVPASGGVPVRAVSASLVRDFPDLRNVEGVSSSGGRTFYVTDEDERIAVRF